MIKSIVNIVLIVGCILSFSCGSSSSIRDKIFQDDTEDESEKDIEWVYYHPLDTMSITMRMNLFIDSINTFSTKRIVPWFVREPCFDRTAIIYYTGIPPDKTTFSWRASIIRDVADTLSLKLLIQELENDPVSYCYRYTKLNYNFTTTKDMLKEKLEELRNKK
jgi:hypothetical protein